MIVSAEEYKDFRMKLELCSLTLSRLNLFMGKENIGITLDKLLKYYSRLELQYLEFAVNQRLEALLIKEEDGFLFRAAGIVAKGAQSIVQQAAYGPNTQWSSSPKKSPIADHSYEQQREHEFQLFLRRLSLRESTLKAAVSDVPLEQFEIDKDSHVVTLARETLMSCVYEATLIRDPAKEAAFDSMSMIQIGVSLLLDIVDADCSSSILNEMQHLLEEKAAEALEQLANSAQSDFVVPDEDIVQQLCTYGFNVNGARRSAVATQNISCAKALEWAMQHERDVDFDLPLISQKCTDDNEGRVVDQVAIQNVRNAFRFASQKLKEKAIVVDAGNIKARLSSNQQSAPIEQSNPLAHVPDKDPVDDFGWDDDSFDIENVSVDEGAHIELGFGDNPKNMEEITCSSKLDREVPTYDGAKSGLVKTTDECFDESGWDGDSFDLDLLDGTNDHVTKCAAEEFPDSKATNVLLASTSIAVDETKSALPSSVAVQSSCRKEARIQESRRQYLASPTCLDQTERQRLALEGRKLLQASRSGKISLSSQTRSPTKAELTPASREKLIVEARKLLAERKQTSPLSRHGTTTLNCAGGIIASHVDAIQMETKPISSRTLEDRKRLALEGRRMLEQARKSKVKQVEASEI
eukprot:CAMPEP_0116044624 /NCGR_PEP_ID=MMETSP0321-20121206/27120_1 /TAXON_ID=163516 /ORGANISM="Leptocylindrus danicus var. danicus, Strain B650" /LENGTH=636 /DNA_ID=CAMNT_0003525775 /DNA_START=38 /DNA_END=1947 /DNA_ORIENTATION=+